MATQSLAGGNNGKAKASPKHALHFVMPIGAPLHKKTIVEPLLDVSAHFFVHYNEDAWATDVLLHCSQEPT